MADLKHTLALIRAKRAELSAQYPDGGLYMVTLPSAQHGTIGGRMVQCDVALAAEGLVKGTHFLATEEAVAQYKLAQEKARKDILAADARAEGRIQFIAPQPEVKGRK